jgi:hypothetical protein
MLVQVVIDALYRPPGAGHACLAECCAAVRAAALNAANVDLSVAAVPLVLRCGARLAERPPEAEGAAEAAPAEPVRACAYLHI